jgi:hypothetical protein
MFGAFFCSITKVFFAADRYCDVQMFYKKEWVWINQRKKMAWLRGIAMGCAVMVHGIGAGAQNAPACADRSIG